MALILIAEDDTSMRRAIERSLLYANHEVLLATGGQEALDLFERHDVDLSIVDIFMPGMDGMELIIRLKQRVRDAKIIAISGGGVVDHERVLDIAARFGAIQTMAKPFTPDELLTTVNEVLGAD
ncbi:MAG: response regulator [Gemmatimonadales bacterium]